MKDYSQRFPVWFCDVWGVIHNGYAPFPAAVDALRQHRAGGGCVVLLTNSPRSERGVERQLAEVGVARDAWDVIVTSGDVTRTLMLETSDGRIFHVGPSRDLSLFEDLAIERVELPEASAIVCTGLVRELEETPEDYRWLLAAAKQRGLPFICANPDKVVRKGSRLVYCAGAIAELYQQLGGAPLMAGKPFAPIYDLAMRKASAARQRVVMRSEVLAIGDGPETDIKGAADYGLACVLISGGINQGDGVEAATRAAVPLANIVRTLPTLTWS